ncbi:SDR family oxidoreductase [uncultured Nocardioides sp.]|uniref:SDR family NAD(P)-dependent oxidoreductase n=1 Tax=uncultured Nocardioides sp. TaxID=198441 RepID=UPI002626A776|nr:SDR family oxidoreductase [uncultured Nocardioides sp.]
MTAVAGSALVTGASRGLGAAIATGLAAAGHPVAVGYREGREAAQRVVEAIRAAGGTAEAVGGDVTTEAGVRRAVDAAEAALGPVGVLVVNATGPQPRTPTVGLDLAQVEPMLDFFVRSPVLLMASVVPGMVARGGGRIVHVGSEVAWSAPAGAAAYVAAKGAQHALARVSAKDLGPHGITVNTVAPGWVPVERHADADPADLAAYAATVPLGRQGTPGEVASAVVWLASAEAGFVTGTVLPVTGGASMP